MTLTATVSATGTPTGTVTFEDTINGTTTTLGTASACQRRGHVPGLVAPRGQQQHHGRLLGRHDFQRQQLGRPDRGRQFGFRNRLRPSATAADGTAGSLRAAVAAGQCRSRRASTIVLSSGVYSLTQGELNYTNTAGTLTIIGQGSTGPNATVIDQLSLDRVLNVAAGTTVILENVELTGGVAVTDQGGGTTEADGGGILVNGSLSLNNYGRSGQQGACPGRDERRWRRYLCHLDGQPDRHRHDAGTA